MTLAELIEKVEGLTGPDREVDALVWSATLPRDGNGLDGYGLPENAWFEYEADDRGAVTMYAIVGGESFKRAKRPAPELTTSLDAAVALCERVLPGWMKWLCEGHNEAGESEWTACLIHPSKERIDAHATAATIALVLSTLRALQKDASDAG